MSIALIAGIVVVFIALVPSIVKAARGKERKADRSGDGGGATSDTGSSADCGDGGGGGCD